MPTHPRQTFVVTYDICDPDRLRRVYKMMRGYGEHLQLSVFRCELSPRELVELRAKLQGLIDMLHDQVLFVDVGPAEGRAGEAFSTLGRAYVQPARTAIIV